MHSRSIICEKYVLITLNKVYLFKVKTSLEYTKLKSVQMVGPWAQKVGLTWHTVRWVGLGWHYASPSINLLQPVADPVQLHPCMFGHIKSQLAGARHTAENSNELNCREWFRRQNHPWAHHLYRLFPETPTITRKAKLICCYHHQGRHGPRWAITSSGRGWEW